jgi:hypothetical protein
MTTTVEFVPFPKIARLSRPITITEKIDGTNAQVAIMRQPSGSVATGGEIAHYVDEATGDVLVMRAGSRSRWIIPGDDNFGFAAWAQHNAVELFRLGEGTHFGEWWGKGIQRGYLQTRKRFSLFNTARWSDPAVRPACCDVVPVLYEGVFDEVVINKVLFRLGNEGSVAAPGFPRPEGIIIWHAAEQTYFKKTLCKDEEWKGKVAA